MTATIGRFFLLLFTSFLFTACASSTPAVTPTHIVSPTPESTPVTASTPWLTPTRIPAPVVIPLEGLVAFYPLSENANDESGNGNHGIVTGAFPYPDAFGNPNSSYHFDGVNSFISIPASEALKSVVDFTIVFRVKPEIDPDGDPSSLIVIASQGLEAGGWEIHIPLNIRADSGKGYEYMLDFVSTLPNRQSFQAENILPDQWNCIVIQYQDSQNHMAFYVDGKPNREFWDVMPIYLFSPHDLVLGSRGRGQSLIGNLDDFAIYDRLLSRNEIGGYCGKWVAQEEQGSTPAASAPTIQSAPGCDAGFSRLEAGVAAMVTQGTQPNRVRSAPTASGDNVLYLLYPGTTVQVLGGPVCSSGLVFWKVAIPGYGSGWTAEGDGMIYWLEPYSP